MVPRSLRARTKLHNDEPMTGGLPLLPCFPHPCSCLLASHPIRALFVHIPRPPYLFDGFLDSSLVIDLYYNKHFLSFFLCRQA